MIAPELQLELNKNKKEPVAALMEVMESSSLRFIAFGEKHVPGSPVRAFVKSVIENLANKGFTHLALELPASSRSALAGFANGSLTLNELAMQLTAYSTSLFGWKQGKATPCEHYFQMLSRAQDAGLTIFPVDKDRGRDNELWNSKDFALAPRDHVMANSIIRILEENPQSRVAYYGGNNHLYARPAHERGRYLSLAEQVSDYLEKSGAEFWSVAGLSSENASDDSAALSFAALTDFAHEDPFWIACNSSTLLSNLPVGFQRRCAWGSCQESGSPKNRCPGLDHGICSKGGAAQIKLGYWSSLILFPS